MSLEDRPVPYDKTATRWKIARQIAKLPKNLVNESLVFTSPNTPRSTPKESRVRVLEKRVNELEVKSPLFAIETSFSNENVSIIIILDVLKNDYIFNII